MRVSAGSCGYGVVHGGGPFARERFLAIELKAGWLEGAAGMVVASGRKLSHAPRRHVA